MKYAISHGVSIFYFYNTKIRILLFYFIMEIVEYEERTSKIE